MIEALELVGCLVAAIAPLWGVCKVWEIQSKRKARA